jgi:hypothetical protein
MSDSNDQGGSYKGYSTPGQDRIEQSTSSAVPSPSTPSEERIQAPKDRIESIGETPGDANPALVETVGAEQGQVSTADLLRAREAAEEQGLRGAGGQMYADQPPGGRPEEWAENQGGRPNFPYDREEPPIEHLDPPGTRAPYGATGAGGGSGIDTEQLEGRADSLAQRTSNEATRNMPGAGLPQAGSDIDSDNYERREFTTPDERSEMDMFAPGMVNLPPEDEDGR